MMISNIFLSIYFSLLLLLAQECLAQDNVSFEVNVTTGLVYFLLVVIFMLNFGTPILVWIYVQYLESYVEKVTAEVEKVQKRISDRISDAGRRISEQMRWMDVWMNLYVDTKSDIFVNAMRCDAVVVELVSFTYVLVIRIFFEVVSVTVKALNKSTWLVYVFAIFLRRLRSFYFPIYYLFFYMIILFYSFSTLLHVWWTLKKELLFPNLSFFSFLFFSYALSVFI